MDVKLERNHLACLKYVSDDPDRYPLTGLHVEGAHVVATNGHCLVELPLEQGAEAPAVTIEPELLHSAKRLAPLQIVGKEIIHGAHGAVFPLKQVEGKYPDWDTVFPKDKPIAVLEINSRYLLEMLEFVSKLPSVDVGVSHPVRMEIHPFPKPLVLRALDFRGLIMPLLMDSSEAGY